VVNPRQVEHAAQEPEARCEHVGLGHALCPGPRVYHKELEAIQEEFQVEVALPQCGDSDLKSTRRRARSAQSKCRSSGLPVVARYTALRLMPGQGEKLRPGVLPLAVPQWHGAQWKVTERRPGSGRFKGLGRPTADHDSEIHNR